MAIRKEDLRVFISKKVKDRKAVLWDVVYKAIQDAFRPIVLEKYKDVEPIERQAQRLHDGLFEIRERHARFKNKWDYGRILRDLNEHLIGLREDIVRSEASRATYNLLDKDTNGLPEYLTSIVDQLKDELAKHIAEYQDISTLSGELHTIIDTSRNGDKAFERLKELGVDLSDFSAGNAILPAVVKLSVNPCVLNGNCG